MSVQSLPEWPSVTVLIPARPGQQQVKALTASQALDYPKDKIEIIVVRGKQPSVQRNEGLKTARGELIYFLDDDSVPPPGNLRRGVAHFADPSVKMAGGPNLCPADAPELEQIFSVVLSSQLAFGPSRARYIPVGSLRDSSEKELILCNLMGRRADILRLGGFDEKLYPNEENALMDQLQKEGGKLLYDPEFLVERRPRPTMSSFCRMLKTYGRGRAEQFRVNPTTGSLLNLAPPGLCVYLMGALAGAALVPKFAPIIFAPLAVYGLLVLLQVVVHIPRFGARRSLCAAPFVVLTHLLYGYGFWKGLFTRLRTDRRAIAAEIELQIVQP